MAEEKIKSPTVKKTPTAKKPARKTKTATHPPYFQMIKEALMSLKDKNGSSPYAIAKKIEEKYKSLLPENFRKTLSLQLKNSVAKGKLVKIRASYKLSETSKRTTRHQQNNKKQEERETKTTTRSSSRTSKKTMSVNKQEKKRKSKKARQPKSIKSSAGKKKAMKASAA